MSSTKKSTTVWSLRDENNVRRYTESKEEAVEHYLEGHSRTVSRYDLMINDLSARATELFLNKTCNFNTKESPTIFSGMKLQTIFRRAFLRIAKEIRKAGPSPTGRFYTSIAFPRARYVRCQKGTTNWFPYIGDGHGLYEELLEKYVFFRIFFENSPKDWLCTENGLLEILYKRLGELCFINQWLPEGTVYTCTQDDNAFTRVTILADGKAQVSRINLDGEETQDEAKYNISRVLFRFKPTTRVTFWITSTSGICFHMSQEAPFGTPDESNWTVTLPKGDTTK